MEQPELNVDGPTTPRLPELMTTRFSHLRSTWMSDLIAPEPAACMELCLSHFSFFFFAEVEYMEIWSDLAQQEAARLRDGWVWRGGGNLGRGRWGWGRADTNTLVTDALANGVQLRVATGGGG
uniref:Uncharacterized protein OSJNBa0010P20.11 n=1 Tax=Oryza sativa TaxID=4530 RepID=Q94I81_ORYSA|nr:Hypothetical protein [Oryza sativa]